MVQPGFYPDGNVTNAVLLMEVPGSYGKQDGQRGRATLPVKSKVTLSRRRSIDMRTSTAPPGEPQYLYTYSLNAPYPAEKWSTLKECEIAPSHIPHNSLSNTKGGSPLKGAFFKRNDIVFVIVPFQYRTTKIQAGQIMTRSLNIGDSIKLLTNGITEHKGSQLGPSTLPTEENLKTKTFYKFQYLEEKVTIATWKSDDYHTERDFRVCK